MINVGEVKMVPLNSISISDRARKEMGDLDGMEKSMHERGLISPLAVKQSDNGTYRLLAGERRFIVLERNKVELIPVRIYPDGITDLEMKSIELAENFYRKDFEYWETDNLIREIHELQQSIHGVAAPGPGHQGWTLKDTAAMAGVTDASVSTAIKRSEAREAFPELFEECKTQKDATKIIKKIDEMITKEEIARKLESNRSDSKINQLAKSYIIADFFEGVKKIPDNVIHLVEIDPPYAIDLNAMKKTDGESIYVQDQYNEIPSDQYQVFLSKLFHECYRVMTEHSWLLCWFAPEPWFEIIYQELHNAGFTTTRMCGIWNKGYGQAKRPELYLANSYEMFFYAWKGRPVLNKEGRANVFTYPPVSPQQKSHPTERPVDLMTDIYDTFAFTGSRVLIPFLGSGSGIIAANNLGMTPVGFELSKSYRDSFLVKLHNMKVN
jgi:site-specific DNA-methyltransferase (adenine-specific)